MFPLLLLLGFSPADFPGSSALRTAWESCLQSYAQIDSVGSNSNITIAVNARAACSAEKDRYTKALVRQSSGDPSPATRALQQVASDEKALTIRLIAFLRRIRER